MTTEKRQGGPKKGQVYKKRKPYSLEVCEWCGQTGKGNVMIRWHGKNCKHNPVNKGRESTDVKRICPWCEKKITGRIYFRWHGDKCKYNPANQEVIDFEELL